MRLRYKIGILVTALLVTFLYGRCAKKSDPGLGAKLPVPDKEQVLIDPMKHTITVITEKGSKTTMLPDRVSTVDIRKDGTVNVTAKQFGTEIRPFVGAYYSDALRFGAGIDGLYFKKLDLGIGIAGGSSAHTVALVQCTYNIWSHVNLGVTYDHMGHIGAALTIRI